MGIDTVEHRCAPLYSRSAVSRLSRQAVWLSGRDAFYAANEILPVPALKLGDLLQGDLFVSRRKAMAPGGVAVVLGVKDNPHIIVDDQPHLILAVPTDIDQVLIVATLLCQVRGPLARFCASSTKFWIAEFVAISQLGRSEALSGAAPAWTAFLSPGARSSPSNPRGDSVPEPKGETISWVCASFGRRQKPRGASRGERPDRKGSGLVACQSEYLRGFRNLLIQERGAAAQSAYR